MNTAESDNSSTTLDGGNHNNIPRTSFSAATTTRADPIDTSMALTVLVLLIALFFMAFFSIYVRRSSAEENPPSRRPPPPPPPSKRGGLDKSAVNSLPVVLYGEPAAKQHLAITDCSICLSEFHEGESVKLIPYCGHVFHPMCVDTWLDSHVTCPLCRSAQLFERGEEVRLDVARCRSDVSVAALD